MINWVAELDTTEGLRRLRTVGHGGGGVMLPAWGRVRTGMEIVIGKGSMRSGVLDPGPKVLPPEARLESPERALQFGEGELIAGDAVPPSQVGVLVSGVVNVRAMTPGGRVLGIGTLIAPALLDFEVFAATELLAIQVIAKNDCEVVCGSRAELMTRLQQDPAAIMPLLESQFSLLRELRMVMRVCVLSRLTPRVAAALLAAAEQGSRQARMSHQELADAVGSSRPSVTRVLLRMKRAGLIDTGRLSIQLRDMEALQGAVC